MKKIFICLVSLIMCICVSFSIMSCTTQVDENKPEVTLGIDNEEVVPFEVTNIFEKASLENGVSLTMSGSFEYANKTSYEFASQQLNDIDSGKAKIDASLKYKKIGSDNFVDVIINGVNDSKDAKNLYLREYIRNDKRVEKSGNKIEELLDSKIEDADDSLYPIVENALLTIFENGKLTTDVIKKYLGEFETTENGYACKIDVNELVNKVMDYVITLATKVDDETTINDFYKMSGIKQIVDTYFDKITIGELYKKIAPAIPEDDLASLDKALSSIDKDSTVKETVDSAMLLYGGHGFIETINGFSKDEITADSFKNIEKKLVEIKKIINDKVTLCIYLNCDLEGQLTSIALDGALKINMEDTVNIKYFEDSVEKYMIVPATKENTYKFNVKVDIMYSASNFVDVSSILNPSV